MNAHGKLTVQSFPTLSLKNANFKTSCMNQHSAWETTKFTTTDCYQGFLIYQYVNTHKYCWTGSILVWQNKEIYK